jgi:iron complex outermembrane recepter protein
MQAAATNANYISCVRSHLTYRRRCNLGAAYFGGGGRTRVWPCYHGQPSQHAWIERCGHTNLCLAIVTITVCSVIRTQAEEAALTSRTGEPGITIEEVIVTGSNIPTAEEIGPNPVDTYRPADLEKLGIRNATDLQTFLPHEAGGTTNLNMGTGDGTVQINLRGVLPRETLVLVDGKRVAFGSLAGVNSGEGVDISLIPFSMIDHIDILKDGASAVYGSDAIAGVINFFLVHKFRGLEIGASYGNTNLGASNDMGEWEGWIKAGTGDDKTDIVVIADFWERTGGLFSRDRDLSANAFFIPFGGTDQRSRDEPGYLGDFPGLRLIPKLFFSPNSPPAHSAPNAATSPFYKDPFAVNPNAYPGAPGIIGPHATQFRPQTGTDYKGGGDYFVYNFAAVTAALPPADRQAFYGSFTRDLCGKHLTIFADFKYVRTYFDSLLAAVAFTPDPFKQPGTNIPFGQLGISVPIQNPFNPFTVADATISNFFPDGSGLPVTTGVRFRGINDTGPRSEKFTYRDTLFDVGVEGEMGEFGDFFKSWNWETGFRYSRNEGQNLSVGDVSQPGLRQALLDTDPATAFNPFLGFLGRNSKAARSGVYVTLQNTGQFESPLTYVTINGDLFNLPAGPVSFAMGGEYRGERMTRDRDPLNQTFDSIGSVDGQSFRANRDVWSIYQEVRVPFTSPTWNFPGLYSFEVDFAEREEWYSQNTSAVLSPFQPATSSQYNAQKPKVSVRWQPLDPKYLGALILRGSYSEAFHAPTLFEMTPAGTETFVSVVDPFSRLTSSQVQELDTGNPLLQPEVAYEWSYGIVYSPKWLNSFTVSADWWHIDIRSLIFQDPFGANFIIESNPPPAPPAVQNGPLVFRAPSSMPNVVGPVISAINPNLNLSGVILEGLDYEATCILESSMFGHGDWGRLTATVNGTWLSRSDFRILPNDKEFGIAGLYIIGNSFPWNRANFSLYYDGPANTWLAGLDVGAVVHWTGQYNDDNVVLTGDFHLQTPRTDPLTGNDSPRARKIAAWTTLDLILNYTFNLAPTTPTEVRGFAKNGGKIVKTKDGKEKNVVPVSTAEYNPCGWRGWLNNTTISLGIQNVLDADPPFAGGSIQNGYDESLATIKGRFCYVQVKKKF